MRLIVRICDLTLTARLFFWQDVARPIAPWTGLYRVAMGEPYPQRMFAKQVG
jgi:hypothetical protein